jgi:DNA-binding SARP family transcriptional activator/predicted ATPase
MTLKISLLGQFKIQAGDQTIELPSRPAQSLLAYLALNAGAAHRRENLASLLWPEASESNARGYLRQALWRIRKSLENGGLHPDDFLKINDISVTFNDQSGYWLDAVHLLDRDESRPLDELIEIARLYRGELLPGFYEEWVLLARDRLEAAFHQKMNLLLERLIQAGEWDQVLEWSEHWIQLGHSPEPAFRALILAYAGLGDQSMVSAAYQRCVQALGRELELEPSPETQRLYEQILQGEKGITAPHSPAFQDLVIRLPTFLQGGEPPAVDKSILVARERELKELMGYLDLALTGQGRVVFVTGVTGSGKTALISEFIRRAQNTYANLIVASGNCNAQTGLGDPYLPFREILGLLTGDVEARWAAGAITREHARLLWETLPFAARALVESGPDLIDTFVPAAALLERAAAFTPSDMDWQTRLAQLAERKTSIPTAPNLQQGDLFEQYTRVLKSLAQRAPLVLVLDDLQWADLGSTSLLFHLVRHLAGSSILVVGAYRPEEVALDRDEVRHPLKAVLSELKRQFGDITVSVDQAEKREFVDAFLDSEPNDLGPPFRQMLYRQTHGNPLFTVELLRGMQERGDLVKDQAGRWVEGPALDWEKLPARVEAVVAERIDRLRPALRTALRVASVEGETFTAEVVARVMQTDERALLESLSGELDRKHRLIRAYSITRVNGQLLSSYRFQHNLFQKYLYNSLDEVERVHLHEQVGNAFEKLYAARGQVSAQSEIALQLARHFQEARIADKAVHYLQQAGERALGLSAYQEAITHLTRGLSILKTLPESTQRDQLELALQMALSMAWVGPSAYGSQVKSSLTRARQLCQGMGKTRQLARVLGELAVLHYVQGELQEAHKLAEEALSLSQQIEDPMLVTLSHWYLGFIRFSFGEYTKASAHLQHVIDYYDPEQHHRSLIFLRGSDAGISALAYQACCLWCLGFPEQALRASQEALALARKLDHPFSQADVLCYGGCSFNAMRRDWRGLMESSKELIRLADEQDFAGWRGTGASYHGEALVMIGQVSDGISQIRQGIAANEPTGVRCYLPGMLRALGEAQSKAGHPQVGLATLNEALDLVEQGGERHWEAELYRLKGALLCDLDDEAEAEINIRKAIQVARRQGAKSWELRAATDLARLCHDQGHTDEACKLLKEVYTWFTEGFDTPDLIAAGELLEELSQK